MRSNQQSATGNQGAMSKQRSGVIFWLLIADCWLLLSRFSF
jgi:hypothetical protein